MRLPLKMLAAVSTRWPVERPMSVRISAVDWHPEGNQPAVAIARLLKAAGCDVIDVSAGQTMPEQKPVYGRLFQTPFAHRIRHEVGIATMAVGAISSYADADTIVAARLTPGRPPRGFGAGPKSGLDPEELCAYVHY